MIEGAIDDDEKDEDDCGGGGEVEGVVATELIELLLQEHEQLQFEHVEIVKGREADTFRSASEV